MLTFMNIIPYKNVYHCEIVIADGHKVDQMLWSSQELPQYSHLSEHGKTNGDSELVVIFGH